MQNKWKIFILAIVAIIITLLVLNFQKHEKKNEINNNRSEIIKTLLDSALYKNRLPNSNYLKNQFPFGDTIIFKYNALLKNHLPNKLKCKILTEQELCHATAIYRDRKNGFRYFLELKIVEKKDLLNAALECHCIYYNEDNKLCEPQNYCNGTMSMKFKISNNKLKIGNPFFSSY